MRSARSARTGGRRVWQSLAQEKKAEAAAAVRKMGVRTPLCETGRDNGPVPFFCRRCRCRTKKSWPITARPGLSLRAHPISFYRRELDGWASRRPRGLAELANEAPVRVAGLVLLRQRPGTAKGITFVTLEDETGTVNLVVHQHTWDRYYRVARRAPAWIAHGHIQTTRDDQPRNMSAAVIHVVVRRLEALAEQLRRAGREVAGFSVETGAADVRARDGNITRSRPPASRC